MDRLTARKLGNLVNTSMKSALGVITAYFIMTHQTSAYNYVAFKTSLNRRIVSHATKFMHYDEAVQLNVDEIGDKNLKLLD